MQFFEQEIIKKKYHNLKLLKYIGLTLFVLTILITIGTYLFKKDDLGKPMNDYILANTLEEENKAYINVVEEPIYIGNYSKEDKIYFLVKDGNYSYVAKISEENYHKYQNATVENPVVMSGTTKQISETLMMAIMNAINKNSEKEDYVDANWFVKYLGLLYLDEGEEPNKVPVALILLVFFGGLSVFLILGTFLLKFHYEKNISYMSLEEIEKLDKEMSHASTYPSLQVSITKHYLINLKGVFEAFLLDSILFIYPFEIKQGDETKNKALKVITDDFKEHNIAVAKIDSKEFDKFYKELGKTNKNMLVGYSKKNQNALKQMQKDAKN